MSSFSEFLSSSLPEWLTANKKTGEGHLGARTVEFAGTILSVSNIGSMTLIVRRKTWWLAFIGACVALTGLDWLFGGYWSGLLALLVGGILIAVDYGLKAPTYLSIGTCDGRFTNIVSKNRETLEKIQEFLHAKMDLPNTFSANFNTNIDTGGGGFSLEGSAFGKGGSTTFNNNMTSR